MTSRLRGPDGLKQELKLSPAKRMTRGYPWDYSALKGCPWDYNAGHYTLKTFNRWPGKTVSKIKRCPFKALRLLKEG